MSIFSISDLHLSFNKPVKLDSIKAEEDIDKPMSVFGWGEYYNKVANYWLELIKENDTVLIPGDISWAINLEQAYNDFFWISQLPGRKILSPGNHCYYAGSKRKVRNALPEGMEWIDADFTVVEDTVIAATRGWNIPGDKFFNAEDKKIYERQVGRLRMALEEGHKKHPKLEKIVMLHYPPITNTSSNSGFMEVMNEYEVKVCVYGHLHGVKTGEAIEGVHEGIDLKLVSCDALNFRPLKVKD